jgi:hypothetical protein
MKSPITEFQELAGRIEMLEASNRRWRLITIVLLVSSISMILIAAKAPDRVEPSVLRVTTVEARDIILKDEKGNVCARLSVLPIIERRGNGVPVVVIQSDTKDRAVLTIYDDQGRPTWTAPPSPILVQAR